jgi:hypothetical protein
VLTKYGLLCISSDVLEYLPRMIVVVNLLLEELGEACDALDLSSARQLLNHANHIAHDVLGLVIRDVGHVLLEDIIELIDKGVDLAHYVDGRPSNQAVQDAQALDHALLSCVLKALDGG